MWNKIKPYMPWNVIEFFCYYLFFAFMNEYVFHSGPAGLATALASCGMFMAIQTRRKLDNGEYK